MSTDEALVVFHDLGTHPLSRLLRPGFRHVFACIRAHNRQWLVADSAEGVPHIDIVADADSDLAAFYRGEGFTVVRTRRRGEPYRLPFALANCVGMTKAVLGLHAPLTVTPFALYRLLLREQRRQPDAIDPARIRPVGAPTDPAARGPERDT